MPDDVWIGCQIVLSEFGKHPKREVHHQVGSGEAISNEVGTAAQLAVEKTQHLRRARHEGFDHRLRLIDPWYEPAQEQMDEELRHSRALCEVHPLQIAWIIRRADWHSQPPTAVAIDDVFDDRA